MKPVVEITFNTPAAFIEWLTSIDDDSLQSNPYRANNLVWNRVGVLERVNLTDDALTVITDYPEFWGKGWWTKSELDTFTYQLVRARKLNTLLNVITE